jgi:hypothetical protein
MYLKKKKWLKCLQQPKIRENESQSMPTAWHVADVYTSGYNGLVYTAETRLHRSINHRIDMTHRGDTERSLKILSLREEQDVDEY